MKHNDTPAPVDSFFLNEEQREEIQRLAALGYQPQEMAVCLGFDVKEFTSDARSPGTTIHSLIREGILVTRAAPEMKLHALAEEGNIPAVQELAKARDLRNFENIVRQLDEDELY